MSGHEEPVGGHDFKKQCPECAVRDDRHGLAHVNVGPSDGQRTGGLHSHSGSNRAQLRANMGRRNRRETEPPWIWWVGI